MQKPFIMVDLLTRFIRKLDLCNLCNLLMSCVCNVFNTTAPVYPQMTQITQKEADHLAATTG